jgi:hypothetical protein
MKTFKESVHQLPIQSDHQFIRIQDWRYSRATGVAVNIKTNEVFKSQGFYDFIIEKGIWNSEMLIS